MVLASSDLKRSVDYWRDLAGLNLHKEEDGQATLAFADSQAKLVLKAIGKCEKRKVI